MKRTKRTCAAFAAQLAWVVGIIAILAMVGLGLTACEEDKGDGVTINISDTALHGTWKGDATNGTLIFTSNSIGSPDVENTYAKEIADEINDINDILNVTTYSSNLHIKYKDGGLSWKYYNINGSTLTLNHKFYQFIGTKQ